MKTKFIAICMSLLTPLCACSFPSGYTQVSAKPSLSAEASDEPAGPAEIPLSGLLTEGLTTHTIDSPRITGEFMSAMSGFSIGLFRLCAEKGENVVLSPASAYTALGMAAVGAEGETLKQFEKVLGSGGSLPETLKAYRALLDKLTKNEGGTTVSFANSVWFDTSRVIPKKAFLQDNVDWFSADVFSEGFSDPSTVKTINGWVGDKTKDRITEIVQEIDASAVVYLINAVCFDAKWSLPFGKAYEGVFKAPGGKADAELMDVTGSFEIVDSGDLTGVLLPYDDGVYSFLAVMPKKSKPLEDVVKKISADTIPTLLESRERKACKVTLPKFKIESTLPMSDAIKELGIVNAFDQRLAGFGRLGTSEGNIYISDVLQKAYISVDEAGTEAAAATSVIMQATGRLADHIAMVFDRPFIYAIIENDTGLPLFIGALNDPSK